MVRSAKSCFTGSAEFGANAVIKEPLPETREAIALGCQCVIRRDQQGRQIPFRDGSDQYCIKEGCPVHGRRSAGSKLPP
jgi:hypothetical protein